MRTTYRQSRTIEPPKNILLVNKLRTPPVVEALDSFLRSVMETLQEQGD